jgi:hypothetical protein
MGIETGAGPVARRPEPGPAIATPPVPAFQYTRFFGGTGSTSLVSVFMCTGR